MIHFGLVQSKFQLPPNMVQNPLIQFDLDQVLRSSMNLNGIDPNQYLSAIHRYNDQFILTTQARYQDRDPARTPNLTDEYEIHRQIQGDFRQFARVTFEPYDLHVVNPWNDVTF